MAKRDKSAAQAGVPGSTSERRASAAVPGTGAAQDTPGVVEAADLGRSAAASAVQRVGLAEVLQLASYAEGILNSLRQDMLKPHPRKRAPQYSASQLAQMCALDPRQIAPLAKRDDLPPGRIEGSRRLFTLQEAHEWVRRIGPFERRPRGQDGLVISCVNFKGGSTKTSTAMGLAQGLTHRGRKVLVVDLDPQASATTLTGLLPAAEIDEWQTAAPITYVQEPDCPKDLCYAVQPTYWDGMDIIPAAPPLFQAEIMLPLLSRDPRIEWWALFSNALKPLKSTYDVIIVDTAPSLSYLAINAVMASDALIMPLPPDNLDFASSVAFWNLLTETLSGLSELRKVNKSFEFIRVLVSRMDSGSASNVLVRDWIIGTYGPYMMPGEIPRSPVNTVGATMFQTLYDMSGAGAYAGDARTYQKLRTAWDSFVENVDQQICRVWRLRDAGDAPAGAASAQPTSPTSPTSAPHTAA